MFNLTIRGFLSRADLQKEKTKDYRNIVLIHVAIIIFGLTLSEPLMNVSSSSTSKLIISVSDPESQRHQSRLGSIYGMLIIGKLLGLPRAE